MSDITAKFTIQQNEPLQAKFTAYDEPPSVVVETKSYNELEDKPSINDVELVGNKTAEELGLASTSDIPDLTDYVKNTDYATASTAGIIIASGSNGVNVNSGGYLYHLPTGSEYYGSKTSGFIIGKGTLENIKDDYVKRGVTENQIELTEDEKASAKNWLGFATPTEIMQAIASIPQFSISIVDELPLTGEKMILYLVSKGTESPDVYDEYIWIEETSSFEFLGTTAVDLTDYVKKTDYMTSSKGGCARVSRGNGVDCTTAGYLYNVLATDSEIRAKYSVYKPIVPASLDYAVKTSVTTNTIELTDDEKTSACNWLGTAKTVLTTEADYEALETKDANTLYLIEE